MPQQLRILSLNARSIVNKIDELELLLLSYNAQLVVISETWLSDKISSDEIVPPGYKLYRRDRVSRGGGVAVVAKENIAVTFMDQIPNHESLFLNVKILGFTFLLCAVYRPPDAADSYLEELYDFLLPHRNRNVIITGDFNLPDIDWKQFRSEKYATCNVVLDILLAMNLDQVVQEPTRENAVLDLFFISQKFSNGTLTIEPGISDHRLLLFSWSAPHAASARIASLAYIRDYVRADDESIIDYMERKLVYHDFEDVHFLWKRFKEVVNHCTEHFVPMKRVRKGRRNPWISREIIQIKRKLKRLCKQHKTGTQTFRELKHSLTAKIALAKGKYFKTTLPEYIKNDPQKFWRFLSNRKDCIKEVKFDGELVTDEVVIAKCFNEYFQSVFINDSDTTATSVSNSSIGDVPVVSVEGVLKMLRNLKIRKSAGPDGLSNVFLNRYADQIAEYMTRIFQVSLQSGDVPEDWHNARVVPIHKKGDKCSVGNYRPVSVTCTSCKFLEHIVAGEILDFLTMNNILSQHQHGFRRGMSTVTQLVTTVHEFAAILDRSGQVDVLLLDFCKAFDKVSHAKLLHKLSVLGLPQYLVNWITAYLRKRSQFVDINGCLSPTLAVLSGVPQGSVLGPLLFIIFINDITEILPESVSIRLFADDCIIFKEINSINDHEVLQESLLKIDQWCGDSKMQLNASKSVLLRISRKQQPSVFEYRLNQSVIPQVTQYRYLGVTLTNDLTWTAHITDISSSAFRKLCVLRRKIKDTPSNIKLLAYLALVRPKLEYACALWDPYTKKDIHQLERIQRKAVRFIFGKYRRHEAISELMQNNQITPLETRRKIARLFFLQSILCKRMNITPPSFLGQLTSRRTRHTSTHALKPIFARTVAFYNSFFPRTISEWNSLPEFVVQAHDFHHCLEEYLLVNI